GIDHDARVLVAADRAARDLHWQIETLPAIVRDRDENRRVAAESREVRPRDIDRSIACDRDRLMVGELPVGPPRLAFALEGTDERERMLGTARGPGAAAIG